MREVVGVRWSFFIWSTWTLTLDNTTTYLCNRLKLSSCLF